MPHGALILDPERSEMAGTPLGGAARRLHEACFAAGCAVRAAHPHLIILYTPHGLHSDSADMCIYQNSSASGSCDWMGAWGEYRVSVQCDAAAARSLLTALQAGGHSAAGLTAFSGYDAPLRWGECVPLSSDRLFPMAQRFTSLLLQLPHTCTCMSSPLPLCRPLRHTAARSAPLRRWSCSATGLRGPSSARPSWRAAARRRLQWARRSTTGRLAKSSASSCSSRPTSPTCTATRARRGGPTASQTRATSTRGTPLPMHAPSRSRGRWRGGWRREAPPRWTAQCGSRAKQCAAASRASSCSTRRCGGQRQHTPRPSAALCRARSSRTRPAHSACSHPAHSLIHAHSACSHAAHSLIHAHHAGFGTPATVVAHPPTGGRRRGNWPTAAGQVPVYYGMLVATFLPAGSSGAVAQAVGDDSAAHARASPGRLPQLPRSGRISFAGRVVLVSGAGHGIGRAIALGFAALGASVLACDGPGEAAAAEVAETAALAGGASGRVVPATVDFRDFGAVAAWAGAEARVDALVLCAGGVLGHVRPALRRWRRGAGARLSRTAALCAGRRPTRGGDRGGVGRDFRREHKGGLCRCAGGGAGAEGGARTLHHHQQRRGRSPLAHPAACILRREARACGAHQAAAALEPPPGEGPRRRIARIPLSLGSSPSSSAPSASPSTRSRRALCAPTPPPRRSGRRTAPRDRRGCSRPRFCAGLAPSRTSPTQCSGWRATRAVG